MKRSLMFLAGAAFALQSCGSVGPNYIVPQITVPSSYGVKLSDVTGGMVNPAQYWSSFNDPVLTDLIERALTENLDMAIAASRVRQARLQEIGARSKALPVVNAKASGSHIELSKNAGLSDIARQFSGSDSNGDSASGFALPGSGISTFAAGFDASWELDIFGGARRGQEAAAARTESAEWNRRDGAIILAGEIAQNYFAMRYDQQQMVLIEQEIVAQKRVASIVSHRADVGLVPRGNVPIYTQNVNANQARLEPLKADIKQRRHALAMLLGKEPSALDAELSGPLPPLASLPHIPAGLPSDLLRRRPDIRAAERNLAAATADIGIAVADLYPRFNLTGIMQLISTALGSLFTGNSLQLTASGAAMFPIFDGGAGKAIIAQREELAEQAYLEYRQTILGALRDVKDALAQLDAERDRNNALQSAVKNAAANSRTLASRFNAGFIAEDEVLVARSNQLEAEEQLAASNAALRQYNITLFKVIGGGWDSLPEVEPVANSI